MLMPEEEAFWTFTAIYEASARASVGARDGVRDRVGGRVRSALDPRYRVRRGAGVRVRVRVSIGALDYHCYRLVSLRVAVMLGLF